MNKKQEKENMEKFLQSELKKEAEEILAEVEANKSLKDITFPEDIDSAVYAMIEKYEAEQAAYDKLSEQDKKALQLGREMMILRADDGVDENEWRCDEESLEDSDEIECVGEKNEENDAGKGVVRFRRKRKRRKAYMLVAVVAVLTMAVGMISIGGAPFLTTVRKQMVGDREMVKVNSDREGEDGKLVTENKEEAFYQEIEDKFGFVPVKLGYIPQGFEFVSSDIDDRLYRTCLLYTCDDSVFEYRIILNYQDHSYGYDIEDEVISEEVMINVQGNSILLGQHYIKDTDSEEYVAKFEYKNAYYILRSGMDKEQFQKILENLNFF